MNVLIIYDSTYGNTGKVAEAMADEAKLSHVSHVRVSDLAGVDLLVVGSPTQGGQPTPPIRDFLNRLPANQLKGLTVAAFDTRFAAQDQGRGLRLLMKLIDYAAPKIGKALASKGGRLVAPPEGFIVTGKEGPLQAGELERAQKWVTQLLAH